MKRRLLATGIMVTIGMLFVLPRIAAFAIETDAVVKWEGEKDLTNLVTALDDGDRNVRERAAMALGRIGDPRALAPLLPVLGDDSSQVRKAAAWAMERLGDPLGKWIREGLNYSREAMAELSERKDSRAVVPLLRALKSRDGNLREAAAWVLWSIGDPGTLDPLIDAVKDSDDNVRVAAAWALEKLGTPRILNPLLAALRDSNHRVREAAAWGLGKAEDRQAVEPLIEALGDRYSKVREAAAWALKKLGEPLGEAIFQSLSGSEKAMEELASMKDRRATVPLVKALEAFDVSVSVAAAQTLGSIGDPEVVDPLVTVLMAAYPEIRLAAAGALGKIGDRKAVDPLILALWDSDEKVRIGAAIALAKINDRRAIDPLIQRLADPDANVRIATALSLRDLGEPLGLWIQEALKGSPAAHRPTSWRDDARSIPVLLRFLGGRDANLRRAAAVALGSADDPRALAGLIDMAGGWNPKDRYLAMTLIADMRHRSGSSELTPIVLRILIRPASLAYFMFGIVFFGFVIDRIIRHRVKRRTFR
jgi:HEAT repeat protein